MLIGTSERPLYAIFSAASGTRQRRAVVLCAPFGDEYARAHRTGRLLAQRLAAAGAAALRFDYYGTGDSGGDDDEFSPDGAVRDTLAAVAEAQEVGGVRHVTLIGLREGAAAAVRATPLARGVDRLVLWDPVLDAGDVTALPTDTLMLVSEDSPTHQRVLQRLRVLSPRVTFGVLPGALPWVPVGEDGIGAVPVEMLARIEGWTP
jgi:alpha-beta hydrolase superfamily lysophospholipase